MSIENKSGCADKESICAQAALLGEMLAQSSEYSQYQEAKTELEGDQERSRMLSLLRQQQMVLRLAEILGLISKDAEDDLEQMYATFCLEPIVCSFLYAEGRLGRLLSEVQQICVGKLDLWSDNDMFESMQYGEVNKELN